MGPKEEARREVIVASVGNEPINGALVVKATHARGIAIGTISGNYFF
jgi:hypothetical protein